MNDFLILLGIIFGFLLIGVLVSFFGAMFAKYQFQKYTRSWDESVFLYDRCNDVEDKLDDFAPYLKILLIIYQNLKS